MKVKGLISAILTASICASSFVAVHAATAEDIAKLVAKNAPKGDKLERVLDFKAEDGTILRGRTDPERIYVRSRLYSDSLDKYSGKLAPLLVEDEFWFMPVVENGEVVGEYKYSTPEANGLGEELLVPTDDVFYIADIYDYNKIAGAINNAGIGEPKDIKCVRVGRGVYIAMYVLTGNGEYVIPMQDMLLAHYNDDDRYEHRTVFEAMKAYTADELVRELKIDYESGLRRREELDANRGSMTYVDENGELAEMTPEPRKTPKPAETPKATATPKPDATDKPTETSQPKSTEKPIETAMPKETEAPAAELTVKSSDGNLEITSNGITIEFPDAKPFIDENGRTQIPVRAVTESLGAAVDWNGAQHLVTINGNGVDISLTIGSDIINVNGKPTQMDTAAVIIDERTYVPIRYVAEAMGMTVVWK